MHGRSAERSEATPEQGTLDHFSHSALIGIGNQAPSRANPKPGPLDRSSLLLPVRLSGTTRAQVSQAAGIRIAACRAMAGLYRLRIFKSPVECYFPAHDQFSGRCENFSNQIFKLRFFTGTGRAVKPLVNHWK